jgi:hypothetical protein
VLPFLASVRQLLFQITIVHRIDSNARVPV